MVIIAWIIFYFYASFHSELAWGSCSNDFNTDGKHMDGVVSILYGYTIPSQKYRARIADGELLIVNPRKTVVDIVGSN